MISVRTIFIALTYLTIASAFELKCNFTIINDMYCCRPLQLNIDEPHTKISSVSGSHSPNLTNADVHYLYLYKQMVKFLPINFAEYFPNLKKIKVIYSKLKFITPNDFLGLTQLSIIYMGHNDVKELPCGVFDTNQRLEEIHFEFNNMTHVGADIFDHLPHLKVVHFRKNTCIQEDAYDSTDVPGLLINIKKKCAVSCYTALKPSCDSKFYKKVLNEMGSTINTFDLNLKELEKNNVGNVNEIKVVKKEKEELDKKFEELEIKHNNTVEKAMQNVKLSNDTYVKMETNITYCNDKIKILGNKVLVLENKLNASNDENLQIINRTEELNNKIMKLETNLTKSIEVAKQCAENIIENNEKLDKLENDLKTVTANNLNLTTELDSSRSENVKILAEIEELNNKIMKLETNLTQSIEVAKQCAENIIENNEKLLRLENDLKTVTANNLNLTTELDSSRLENVKINAEKEELNISIMKLEKNLTQSIEVAKHCAENIIENNEKFEKLENDLKTVTANNLNLTIEIESSRIENVELNKNIKDLETNNNKTEHNLDILDKKIINRDEIIIVKEKEIEILEVTVHSFEKDLDVSKNETVKISDDLKKLETTHNQTVDAAKHKEDKLNNELENLENLVKNITEINSNLESDLKLKIIEHSNLEAEKAQLNRILLDSETEHNKTIRDAKQNEVSFNETIRIKKSVIIEANRTNTILQTKLTDEYVKVKNLNQTIESLIKDAEVLNSTLIATENGWTIRCPNDDLKTCKTKDFPIVVEYYSYINTTLKTFYETKDDTEFKIENEVMSRMPNIIFKHYPKIIYFFVIRSGLESIKNGNFDGASSLIRIGINYNNITYVEASVFEEAKNVVFISLAHNNIERLSDRAFDGLNQLQQLDLSNNKIKFLYKIIFINLPNLEVLHVEMNALTALSGNLFSNNKKLRIVYFNSNNIKFINSMIFQNFGNLVYVNLSNNTCINKEYKNLTNLNSDIRQKCLSKKQ